MKLDYEQYKNGMYKLSKPDFDDIALIFLREYLPGIVDIPREVDINYLAKECLYLDIYSKHLSADKSVLGLIAFADTKIPYYDLRFQPQYFEIKEGSIVIDLSLSGSLQTPRRRFTIAHEVSHWILHRSYHSPTNKQYEFRKYDGYFQSKSSSIERKYKKLETDTDREEWQANSLAAAILMPKIAVLECAYKEIQKQFGASYNALYELEDTEAYSNVIHNIAEVFNVSKQATEIRLEQLDIIKRYCIP